MKKYNKIVMIQALLFMVVGSAMVQAKVRTIQSRRDFERTVAKESMVVALFYDDKNKGLLRMYEDVSDYQTYDDADVIFLKLNAARKELKNLSTLYGITTMPAFIFFNKGKRVIDNKGTAVILTGSVSREETRNKQRLAQENESWKAYFYPRDMFVPSYGPDERTLE